MRDFKKRDKLRELLLEMTSTLPVILDQTHTEVVTLDLILMEAEILATLVTVDMGVEILVILMEAVETATKTTTRCSLCMICMMLRTGYLGSNE